MFIGQRASVSWRNYLNLGEGYSANLGSSKRYCQTKSYWLYWGGKWILLGTTKNRPRTTKKLRRPASSVLYYTLHLIFKKSVYRTQFRVFAFNSCVNSNIVVTTLSWNALVFAIIVITAVRFLSEVCYVSNQYHFDLHWKRAYSIYNQSKTTIIKCSESI